MEQKLIDIVLDTLDAFPEGHPWEGNVKKLVDQLIANGVMVCEKGEWITEYWKSGYIKKCNCSRCGESPKDAYNPDNYCPNCGADMRRIEG